MGFILLDPSLLNTEKIAIGQEAAMKVRDQEPPNSRCNTACGRPVDGCEVSDWNPVLKETLECYTIRTFVPDSNWMKVFATLEKDIMVGVTYEHGALSTRVAIPVMAWKMAPHYTCREGLQVSADQRLLKTMQTLDGWTTTIPPHEHNVCQFNYKINLGVGYRHVRVMSGGKETKITVRKNLHHLVEEHHDLLLGMTKRKVTYGGDVDSEFYSRYFNCTLIESIPAGNLILDQCELVLSWAMNKVSHFVDVGRYQGSLVNVITKAAVIGLITARLNLPPVVAIWVTIGEWALNH